MDSLSALCASHPGHEALITQMHALLTTFPPPFIYVHDAASPRLSGATMGALLGSLAQDDASRRVHFAQINAVACLTPRLLYDSAINALVKHEPTWAYACANWGDGAERWNDNFDGFTHGLRAVRAGFQKESGESEVSTRMVLVIERAERLKETMPDLMVPLTRLREISQVNITTIFLSDSNWDDIKPSLGAAQDPFLVEVPVLSKQAVLHRLESNFDTLSDPSPSTIHAYHPSLRPLYTHFLSALYSVCGPFTQDASELSYIAASRWPGFVEPVLESVQARLASEDEWDEDEHGPLVSEDTRMRLLRLFTPSLTAALEALYPRSTDAAAWAALNKPDPDLLVRVHDPLSRPTSPTKSPTKLRPRGRDVEDAEGADVAALRALPRLSRFLLVAAFLASTNPAKGDVRLFGRLGDGRRRRRGGKAAGGAAKIPQRLVGPNAFALDRALAILGVLLEENDAGVRTERKGGVPGEGTEMEIARVGVQAAIMELTARRVLYRTSPADRLDGPPMFKSAISFQSALALARELGVPLNDLMWDPI